EMAIYRQLRQRVNLDLDNVPMAQALKKLAKDTGTNLVIDPKVQKEAQAGVTVNLDDVPLDAAVSVLTEMAGLKPVCLGNVLFITSEAKADKLRKEAKLVPTPSMPGGAGIVEPGVKGMAGPGAPGMGVVPPANPGAGPPNALPAPMDVVPLPNK